jgi:3-hydroxyacyl-CoA dehydrogenase/enoyl-CoA hydratase/3-hydroxybutyryl-CoA epimerase
MTEQNRNDAVRMDFDPDTGIATLTLEMPGRVNLINEIYGEGLSAGLEWAKAREDLKGIIIGSGHKDFCAGADLNRLYTQRDPARVLQMTTELNQLYRAIETAEVPVVAALTGSALGGGYELALACHHRIALDDARIKVGLPEVQLGVIPGAGGTQRLPRLIGIQAALENIIQAKEVRAPKAVKVGMVDALAADRESLRAAAEKWIAENQGFRQPWDQNKARIPGPRPGGDDARNIFMAACAMLRKKTAGVYPAPERAVSAIEEGLMVAFDRGLEIEGRYFAQLAVSDQTKRMIRTLWFFRQAALKHEGLPSTDDGGFENVAVLGAGMMGAGLAYVSANAGYGVTLKDIKQDALDEGVAYFEAQLEKRGKHLGEEGRAKIRSRLTPTLELDDLAGTDLVIEAVFEDLDLKHTVTQQTEPKLSQNGVWASNTSALPITDLAKASAHAERFIGMHFFSPVEQMPLLEIIVGEKTSDETLARALNYCRAIKKIPIVVNDGYGFYTTRVFSAYILEGAQLVSEGHDPVLIEWAARQAGMVVAPLQVFDEVTLTLGVKATKQSRKYLGDAANTPGVELIQKMVDDGRTGKADGAGFYEYENGRRKRLWPGLRQLATGEHTKTGVDYLARRLLLVQANQAAHCVETGVIRDKRDAEVGAIFGIGFAPNTGGPLSWLDSQDLREVVRELDELAEALGKRYAPAPLLREMAEKRQKFLDDWSPE